MTAISQNFDPAHAMKYAADVVVPAYFEDADGTKYNGDAYFITSGEWELTDCGSRVWNPDVEFIGAVLVSDEDRTLIIHSNEGALPEWIDEALAQAA